MTSKEAFGWDGRDAARYWVARPYRRRLGFGGVPGSEFNLKIRVACNVGTDMEYPAGVMGNFVNL